MKYLLLSILFLTTSFNGNLIKTKAIKLGKEYKVESTFSGDAINNQSFHLIIAKNINKKQFEIIPISNNDDELTRLSPVVFDKVPSILSFHKNNETVSLIVSKKGKKNDEFNVVDINLISGASVISKSISGENFKSIIRKENQNLLLFANDDEIKVVKVNNASTIKEIVATGTEETKRLLKAIDKQSIVSVNTDEFVANGSINSVKAYANGDNVIITNEDDKDGITYISKINVNKDSNVELTTKEFGTEETSKVKKQTSYINNNKLYQLKSAKDNAGFSIYDLDSDKKTDLNLASLSITNKSKGFESVEDFIKKSSRSANEPTITVNNTKKGNLSLRFDYVNKKLYNYQYNWWWHHNWMFQQQMMMMQQQQMIRNSMQRFGPSSINDEMYIIKTEKHYFEIILDSNNAVALDASTDETVFTDIDKQKYIKEIDDNTKVKHTSTVFLKDELRYFGYDKKTKTFRVIKKKI